MGPKSKRNIRTPWEHNSKVTPERHANSVARCNWCWEQVPGATNIRPRCERKWRAMERKQGEGNGRNGSAISGNQDAMVQRAGRNEAQNQSAMGAMKAKLERNIKAQWERHESKMGAQWGAILERNIAQWERNEKAMGAQRESNGSATRTQ